MKQFRHLALLLPLAAPQAIAVPPAGTADEIRERLQPFGQVCRSGETCPPPAVEATLPVDGENWKVMELVDGRGDQTGEQGVQSRWVSSDIRWPTTSASINLLPGMNATMRFTHLDLAGGESSRYGAWENHWISLRIGERETDMRVRRPSDRQDVLLLGAGPGNFIRKALQEKAGDTLRVQMNYQGKGPVEFRFPLAGAAEPLHALGMIDASVVEALAHQDSRDASASEVSPGETPAVLPLALSADGPRSGKAIYDTFCFACHATGVTEAPLFGSLEQWQPRIDKGMDTMVATSLAGLNLMPPMGTCMSCSEDEMRDAIQYMIDSAH